jgi:hypothetical protein
MKVLPPFLLRVFVSWPQAKFILSACKAVEGCETNFFLLTRRHEDTKEARL